MDSTGVVSLLVASVSICVLFAHRGVIHQGIATFIENFPVEGSRPRIRFPPQIRLGNEHGISEHTSTPAAV